MEDLREENARLRAEVRRLEELSRPARSTIVGMTDMLLTIAASGRIVDLNTAAERFFGIRREEVLGLPADVLAREPLEGSHLRKISERARASADRTTEIVGQGTEALSIAATPTADGVQLLISEKTARRTRMTLDGYFSEKVLNELGRVLVDPTQPQRMTASTVVVQLRARGAASASIESGLRNEWMRAASATVLEAGATVDSTTNGRLTALFGAPLPADQHALWAVNTALRVKEALRALVAAWSRRSVSGFDAGFGIDGGEILWTETGIDGRRGFGATGASVERATALASLAASDQILTTPTTFDAVRSVLERRPELLWCPVKFKRSETLPLRFGEAATQTIHISD